MLINSLITHGLAVVAATIVFPILAAWILSLTDFYSRRYYQRNGDDSIRSVASSSPKSPFYSVITASMSNLAEFDDRSTTIGNGTTTTIFGPYGFGEDKSRNYLAPYVIPPISIAIDDDSETSTNVWSDEEDDYWEKRSRNKDDCTISEGLASLRMAELFRTAGKSTKAQRLFEHAISLAPDHPDVLAQYGLFAEQTKRDLVNADYYYTRALLYCPDHALALSRRHHTLPLVREIDTRMLSQLDRKRQRFLRIPRDTDGFHAAARDAYVQYIYHTVAIEGNTMTLTQTRSILETRLAIGGKSVLEHNEILGVDAALRYINTSLVYRRVDSLSVDDIMEIHRRVLGFVDPIEAGRFRRTQVFVGRFEPPPAADVPEEMSELMSWLREETTMRTIHPVELAALMHYKLVAIHPFVDGNGRTARLLMNLILMQAGFPPVVIRLADRPIYYQTLKAANEGDLRPFIRFISKCTDRTLNEYLVRLTTCKMTAGGTIKSTTVILDQSDDITMPPFNSNVIGADGSSADSDDEWTSAASGQGHVIELDDPSSAAEIVLSG